jgi:inner membrane protein
VDNLTHSLFALTLANAGLRRLGRGATAALLVASNIPDIEVVTALVGGRAGYLAAHRGPTHGPLGLGLALATAGAVWAAVRLGGRRDGSASFRALLAVSTVGVAGHVAMDFATSYGTRLLSPFVNAWYGVDWFPIVDVYLWAVLVAGLAAAVTWPRHRARIAAAALAIVAADYAVRGALHAAAVREAVARQARSVAGAATPGPVFHYLNAARPAALPAALPSIASPLRWRLVTRIAGGFEISEVNVVSGREEGDVLRFPDEHGPRVDRAASASLAKLFLDFSRFPAAETMRHRNGDVTVHWYDLRFARRPEGPGDGRDHSSPFAVWVRLSPSGAILAQGLGPG